MWRSWLAAAVLSAGCVSTKSVTLSTNPPGADVVVDGHLVGKSPATFDDTPTDGHYYKIDLVLPGYKPRQVVLKQEENKTTVVCAGLCPPARICMLRSSSLPQSAYTWDLERDLGLPAGAAPGGYPPPPPPMAPPPGNAPSVPPPPTVH